MFLRLTNPCSAEAPAARRCRGVEAMPRPPLRALDAAPAEAAPTWKALPALSMELPPLR